MDLCIKLCSYITVYISVDAMGLNYCIFYLISGERGIVAGWGRLSEGGKLPNILQYVRISK